MQAFVVRTNEGENEHWWNERMRSVTRYHLAECRAAKGQRGVSNTSMWYPDRLAGWLIDKRHLSEATAARMLKTNFPDCADAADLLYKPE